MPNLTLVRVTPAEVFEVANVLLAKMVRIEAHLGVTLPRDERREARNKRPKDVFARMLLVIRNLDILAGAAEDRSLSNWQREWGGGRQVTGTSLKRTNATAGTVERFGTSRGMGIVGEKAVERGGRITELVSSHSPMYRSGS